MSKKRFLKQENFANTKKYYWDSQIYIPSPTPMEKVYYHRLIKLNLRLQHRSLKIYSEPQLLQLPLSLEVHYNNNYKICDHTWSLETLTNNNPIAKFKN